MSLIKIGNRLDMAWVCIVCQPLKYLNISSRELLLKEIALESTDPVLDSKGFLLSIPMSLCHQYIQ